MSSRHQNPIAAGKSSFDLIDPARLFAALRLAPAQLETLIAPWGFRPQPPLAVADHLYLMLFERC
ncbi:hypothetical protein JCM30471_19660 [Desulfuromonas carbonis]|uniref:hypothetical protein n=1 Tax=Desulfuromonas sp. DDH964 TaxID=1823759 RepID=UPI00082C0604|nr:hypothetical protein [Desulfuromonas sp. DDH964]